MGGSADQRLTSAFIGRTLVKPESAHLLNSALAAIQKDAEDSLRVILEAMTAAMGHGHRIEIRGFGSFDVSYRRPRVGRNSMSGERVPVPAKHVPHFRPGKELLERVVVVKASGAKAD